MTLGSCVRAILVVVTLMAAGVSDAAAQARPAPPRFVAPQPSRADTGLTRVPPPSVAAAVRPIALNARERTPTPPVVAPPSPVSTVPDSILQRRPVAAAVVTPPPLAVDQPTRTPLRTAAPALRAVLANEPAPASATGRCKDGSYLAGAASEARCADKGGLAVLFPIITALSARTL